MKVKIEAETEIEYDEETDDEIEGRSSDENEVEIKIEDYIGFFSWSNVALIDGVEKPVLVNPYDLDDDDEKLYLNYQHGDVIIHDPKVGLANILLLESNPTNTIGLSFFSLGGILLMGTTALVAFTLVKFRRKRNN